MEILLLVVGLMLAAVVLVGVGDRLRSGADAAGACSPGWTCGRCPWIERTRR